MSMKRFFDAQANPEKYKSTFNVKRASETAATIPQTPLTDAQTQAIAICEPDFKATKKFIDALVHDVRTLILRTGHQRKLKTASGEQAVQAAVQAFLETQV
jgi:hypothetical protein